MLPPMQLPPREEDQMKSNGICNDPNENRRLEPLTDECTLGACGVGDGGALELCKTPSGASASRPW
jgi:hypothetical protein